MDESPPGSDSENEHDNGPGRRSIRQSPTSEQLMRELTLQLDKEVRDGFCIPSSASSLSVHISLTSSVIFAAKQGKSFSAIVVDGNTVSIYGNPKLSFLIGDIISVDISSHSLVLKPYPDVAEFLRSTRFKLGVESSLLQRVGENLSRPWRGERSEKLKSLRVAMKSYFVQLLEPEFLQVRKLK